MTTISQFTASEVTLTGSILAIDGEAHQLPEGTVIGLEILGDGTADVTVRLPAPEISPVAHRGSETHPGLR